MEYTFDPISGHRNDCHFEHTPNTKNCSYNNTLLPNGKEAKICAAQVARQSCIIKRIDCNGDEYNERLCYTHLRMRYPYHYHKLSTCANFKAQSLGMSYDDIKDIDQYDIEERLGLTSDEYYLHVNQSVREDADEAKRSAEDSVYDSEEASEVEREVIDLTRRNFTEKIRPKRKAARNTNKHIKKQTRILVESSSDSEESESEEEESDLDGFIVNDDEEEGSERDEEGSEEEGSERDEEDKFCGNCGKERVLLKHFCTKCGKRY